MTKCNQLTSLPFKGLNFDVQDWYRAVVASNSSRTQAVLDMATMHG